jgi:hypothetical protein
VRWWCSTAGFTLLDLDQSKPVLTVDHVESIISQDRELPGTEVYPSARPTSPAAMLTFYTFFVVNSRRGFGLSCDDISKKERTNVSSITLHQNSLVLVFSSPQLSRILTEYYADYPRPPAQWLRQTPQATEHSRGDGTQVFPEAKVRKYVGLIGPSNTPNYSQLEDAWPRVKAGIFDIVQG